ncbi:MULTISPECIES: nickel-dependent hydrogenase large subunit [unclassified Lebetimonas]|uniref:hydrogenase large subunit n=1 Tax=unclassified Lebetimonas TaxID=2648158 RepID=UPI0004643CF6|nr:MULTISPECIES: nickel-dependent hydrogenase large subunit [unclassified Lebetimonas]
MGKIVIPFGSQHVALPEPISFLFETQNEIITKVEAHIGYVHRGIEKAAITKFEYNQLPYLTARVCGLCSITHAGAVVHGLEKLMNVEVNKRIDYLRMLVVELDRIHSHMLANGHVAEVVGYENLFMQTFRAREDVMDILERITGNRVQYDYQVIGGVSRDIDLEIVEFAKKKLKKLKENVLKVMDFNDSDYTFGLKTKGVGVISKEMAAKYNIAGPIARASGLETDARVEFDYLPFEEVGYKMQLRREGDVWARNMVRFDEVLNSIEMCENILDNLPEGEYKVKVKGRPNGETVVRVEAPRGECFYYLKGSNKKVMDRVRIRVPTYANIPILKKLFLGAKYSDAQAIVLSFDPCMSCTAR